MLDPVLNNLPVFAGLFACVVGRLGHRLTFRRRLAWP
jgi:hypothetical protein